MSVVLVATLANDIHAGQLHGVIVNQANSGDAKRIEQQLAVLWYLDNQPINSNLVISEVFSTTASRDMLFEYDGVIIKKLKRSRRTLPEVAVRSLVGEIYSKIKKIDKNKRAAVMKKLISSSKK
ncbi:MAG TPA: hypothetical protein DD827_01320 [Gammaproteobacteria bacterium]|nr:hypothetical protein [Gammaproteobacteria bacterium]